MRCFISILVAVVGFAAVALAAPIRVALMDFEDQHRHEVGCRARRRDCSGGIGR